MERSSVPSSHDGEHYGIAPQALCCSMQKRETANKEILIIKQIRCGPTSHHHRSMMQMDPKLWVIVGPLAHEMFCQNTRIRMNVLVSPKAKSTCLHPKLAAPSGQGGEGG